MKNTANPAPEYKPKPDPATLNLRLPKGAKVDLSGFETATVGQDATLTVRGRVVELRASDRGEEWDSGKRLELQVSAVTVRGPAQKASIDDAVTATQVTL
jgi:hypothetical protein